MEPGLAENDGGPSGDEVDRHAGDDLVAALGDRGEAVNQRQSDGHRDRRQHTEPGRACDRRHRPAGEGAAEHLALEADVEDAGTLGIKPGESGENEGH